MNLTTELPSTADLVVVGGGVLGAATAFYASRAGLRVVVVERRPLLATLTTAVAAGGFRAQFDNPEETALVMESIAAFQNFAELAGLPGYDLRLRTPGYLFVTTCPANARRQAEQVALQRAWGIDDVELLDGDEARYRFPFLSEEVSSARFRAADGFLDPKRLTYGFARASAAPFVVSTAVTGFSLAGGRIAGVRTERGDISTGAVVVAAGPFSGPVARRAGLNRSVTTVRRQKRTIVDVPE
ncbi:MAG: NAD(P)/FAD-dependent oxidoreductase, partial [Chloroflexota bacterium]